MEWLENNSEEDMNNFGVLLIHGFAGTRNDVEPLYSYFSKQNYIVERPLLAGHERGKKALAASSYQSWIDSVSDAYQRLRQECSQVLVVGFSMGGLLAVNMYSLFPFEVLVTINTPIYYWNVKQITENLWRDFGFYSRYYFRSSREKPFSSLLEFRKILVRTKPLVSGIHCPTLILQTEDDDTTHPKSALWLYKQVAGVKVRRTIPQGGHMVLSSSMAQNVIKELEDFISAQAL